MMSQLSGGPIDLGEAHQPDDDSGVDRGSGAEHDSEVRPDAAPGDDTSGSPTARRGVGAVVRAAVKELAIVAVLALVLSFAVKTWLFQAFYIPSGSMENTLVKNDRVIVTKLVPGPLTLDRGDVVVFEDPLVPTPWLDAKPENERSRVGGPLHDALVFVGLLPEDSENHLIKRVIGLPGDRVWSDGSGKLKVNGVEITEPYVKPGEDPSRRAFDIVVPEGRVWVMGDNRGNSSDSRLHDDGKGGTGSVPIDKITGRALFVVWPFDRLTWLGTPESTFAGVPAR